MLPLLFALGFTALIILIVLLRGPAGARVEARIDALERGLAEAARRHRREALAWPLRLLLQSVGFALIAAERAAPDAALVVPKLLEELEERRLPALIKDLAGQAPESAAALHAQALLALRRAIGRLLLNELDPAAEARWLDLLEPEPEADPPKAPLAPVDDEAEDRAWPAVVAAAGRLNHVRWAFEERGLHPAIAPAFEAALWTIQGAGPALAARGLRHAPELESAAGALSQLIAAAHTAARLADEQQSTDADQAFLTEARDALLAALAALEGWILAALQGPPEPSLAELAQNLRDRARAVLERTPSTPRLRVQEMLLAHPRGPAAVEAFSLRCVGCLVAEREDLRTACLSHDLDLDALLGHLRGQPAEAGEPEA